MKSDNPFDRRIELGHIPETVAESGIFVTDTLDICWASAQAVFENKASPDHAIAIYALVLDRMKKGIAGL